MEKIGFIGAYDKTDFIIYIAKILVSMNKKVLVIDSTINQKAKYIVPAINPTTSYFTEYEEIDIAVGFYSFNEIEQYLGISDFSKSGYDYILIDIDNFEMIDNFDMSNAKRNFFVTSFDLFSLKKGLEILSGIKQPLELTKILFSKNMLQSEDDYLNYLSLGSKIKWNETRVYFPFENGDQSIIIENQRVAKIKLKGISTDYKSSLTYLVDEIIDGNESANIKKIIKQLEKGV